MSVRVGDFVSTRKH